MEAAKDKVESASAWEVKTERRKETYEVNKPVPTPKSTEKALSLGLHLLILRHLNLPIIHQTNIQACRGTCPEHLPSHLNTRLLMK